MKSVKLKGFACPNHALPYRVALQKSVSLLIKNSCYYKKENKLLMDDKDVSWLSGLLEGEAYFGKRGNYPRISLAMTDRDTIEKANDFLRANNIRNRPARKEHWSEQFDASIHGDKAHNIMRAVYHFMGERRKAKIFDILGCIPDQIYSFDERMWMIGLLEGEGCFMKPSPSAPNQPKIVVDMTDRDILERLSVIWNIKVVLGGKPKKENHTQSYKLILRGYRAVEIMKDIKPFMSLRRQGQINNAICGYVKQIGSNHRLSKLNEDNVREIRQMLSDGMSTTIIASKFGVDSRTIRAIRSGDSWKHVK